MNDDLNDDDMKDDEILGPYIAAEAETPQGWRAPPRGGSVDAVAASPRRRSAHG
jgi:hypothetical protein